MNLFEISSILIFIVSIVAFLNEKFVKLPTTIGVIVISLVASLLLPLVEVFFPSFDLTAAEYIRDINFKEVVLHGFLGFLLFASALNIDLRDLKKHALPISLLATVSVIISTIVVGCVLSLVSIYVFSLEIPLIWYFVFGALISPTDPVAVLAIMKKLNTPKDIEAKIAGESLLNDGTSIVAYTVLLAMAVSPETATVTFALNELFHEAGGGILYGALLGYAGNWLIGKIDSYEVETMLTIAMASAGYAFAEFLHVSAPLAIVVAGIIVGNFSRGRTMSEHTEDKLFGFWHMFEELLNLSLFTLIGLYVVTLTFTQDYFLACCIAVMASLFARFISVLIPIKLVSSIKSIYPGSIRVLTWGGLKGGISVALVLSLPDFPEKELFVVMTYGVVIFSMVVQGLSIGKLIKKII